MSDPLRPPHEYIEEDIRDILNLLDPNPERAALVETPRRVRESLQFMTSGYRQDEQAVLKEFEDGAEHYDEMIFQGGVPLFSLCEHHLLPFFGVAHVAYLPRKHDGKIVGLSKIGRLIEIFARRFQVQERLTTQIADALDKHLKPAGVGVVLRCRHLCMEARGIQKIGTITLTSALKGSIKEEPDAREEFLRFVDLAEARTSNL